MKTILISVKSISRKLISVISRKKITCLKNFPPKIEQLETMITDENAMFDVLGDFFYHVNTKVRVAALEVSDFHVKNKYNCLFTFENSFLSLGL